MVSTIIHRVVRDRMRNPIFIIAPPRSGSTYLFELLGCFTEIVHAFHESDRIWWDLFPYHRHDDVSDKVEVDELSRLTCQALRSRLYDRALRATLRRPVADNEASVGWVRSPPRYLDKTISNCFHLPVIERVLPDAQYVWLVRDPKPNISSMIEGWSNPEMFGKPQLTPIIGETDGATVSHWCYPAPPGWKDQLNRSLPEICAWSWCKHVKSAREFFMRTRKQPIIVKYEDLVANEEEVIQDLANRLGLRMEGWAERRAERPPMSRTTVSSPAPGKWREQREQAVLDVLPIVRETAALLGYDV